MKSLSRACDSRRRHPHGIAAIWFAIVGLVLAAIFALTLDSAKYYYSFHQLQVAADSAALAALDFLPSDVAKSRQNAINDANKNRCADLSHRPRRRQSVEPRQQ